MALPGLFVEYLVTGSMALLWFLPLVGALSPGDCGSITLGYAAAALVPAIYVLGMCIDAIGFMLTARLPSRSVSLKSIVRRWADKDLRSGMPDGESLDDLPFTEMKGRGQKGKIWLHLNAPALIRDIEMRSSRDRIARGAVANLVLIMIVSLTVRTGGQWAPAMPFPVWLALIAGMLAVWAFLERESYKFEVRCAQAVTATLKS